MSLTPRASALTILMEIENGATTLDRRMDRFHHESRFDRRDEAFVTALVYGVLRWRRRLDWIVAQVSTTPLSRIDRDVLSIVRLGLYQMLFMDRVPNSAAVHTSVELAKTLKKRWLAGFVNAVLRNALRRLPEFDATPAGNDGIETLGLAQSMPNWVVRRWADQFGSEETEALCAACNRIPPLTVRANTLKFDRMTLAERLADNAEAVSPTRFAPEGIALEGLRIPLFTGRAFADGWFQVQDEAAQAVGHLLAPSPGQCILDACAGLGGKTAHIAALMHNDGRIAAVDRDEARLRKLDREMQRLGIGIVSSSRVDLQKENLLHAFPDLFDRILLDAPCTGMGVIRRNPDTKWSRQPQDIERCARVQAVLLRNVAPLLKPDGFLVYAVCSTEPEESFGVVNSFLKAHPDFAIDVNLDGLPSSLRPLIDRRGCLLTLPHRHGTDGFFATRLRRR